MRSSDGFVMLMLLLLLPTLLAFVFIICQLVAWTEFKSEFRFNCITESLRIQKSGNSLSQAQSLLEKLKRINSPAKYYVSLAGQNTETKLVYELNYRFFTDLKMKCGSQLIYKEGVWLSVPIYSTEAVRL